MSLIIRKQKILPEHLEETDFEEMFLEVERRPDKPHCQRVEKILDALSHLRQGAPVLDTASALTRLRLALRNYQWTSQIGPGPDGSFRVLMMSANRESLSKDDVWERRAVRALLDVVPLLGKTSRIRRCLDKDCQKWFFARRDDKKFHSAACKQRTHESGPAKEERRERKRAYMKQRYQDAKAREENRKNGVGLRGKWTAKRTH